MRHRIRAARKSEQGFTLTELLIVIVILGVLAGIVVFAVGSFADDAEASACEADRKMVELAVDAYYVKTGGYPTGAADSDRIQQLVTAGYLKSAPDTAITLSLTGVVGPADCSS